MSYQLLRPLNKAERDALKESIRTTGVKVPIEFDEHGAVLDGHHRLAICQELGITDYPRVVRVGMTEEQKREHVLSLNTARRHLSNDELAAIRELRIARVAEARQQGRSLRSIAEDESVSLGQVQADLEKAGVYPYTPDTITGADGKRYPARKPVALLNPTPLDVRRAQEWQDLGEASEAPAIATPSEMRKLYRAATAKPEPTPGLPNGRYRVVYADPPWQYGDKLVDGYGPAEDHYRTLSMDELAGMDVAGIVADDAVLFLWVTSPMLLACAPVIRAWGFEYKASFVWDKVAHNYGHYNSVRHELLLVCTRGSCLPESRELIDSVVEIPRSEVHSAKPRQFRDMIMKLYPTGPRIELFARDKARDWDVWGAEA